MTLKNSHWPLAESSEGERTDPFPRTATKLLADSCSGDIEIASQAMNTLCHQYHDVILRFFLRHIRCEFSARECAQDFLAGKFFGLGSPSDSFLSKYYRLPSIYPDEMSDFGPLLDFLAGPQRGTVAGRFLADRLLEGGAARTASGGELRDRLNALIGGECLIETRCFQEVSLRACTRNLLEASRSPRETQWLNRFLLEDAFDGALPARKPVKFRQVLLRRMKWFLADWFRKEAKAKLISVGPGTLDYFAAEDEDTAFDSDFAAMLVERALERMKVREPVILEYFRDRQKGQNKLQQFYADKLEMSAKAFKVRYSRFLMELREMIVQVILELASENTAAFQAELEHLKQHLPADLFPKPGAETL